MRTNFVLLKTRETKTQNQKHLAKTFNCSYKKMKPVNSVCHNGFVIQKDIVKT